MQPWTIILIVASVVCVGVVAWLYEHRRRKHLQARFGPEYHRVVREMGNRYRAESELMRRERRAERIRKQALNPTDRERFLYEWKRCKAQFVDDPAGAVDRADQILVEIMRTRGYLADTPHERMTDIAAAYPYCAEHYREASQILARRSQGETSTEELRTAFLHFSNLFDDLLGGHDEKLKRAS